MTHVQRWRGSGGSCAASASDYGIATVLALISSSSSSVLSRLEVLYLKRHESTSLAQLSSDPLVSESLVFFEQGVCLAFHQRDPESRSHQGSILIFLNIFSSPEF